MLLLLRFSIQISYIWKAINTTIEKYHIHMNLFRYFHAFFELWSINVNFQSHIMKNNEFVDVNEHHHHDFGHPWPIRGDENDKIIADTKANRSADVRRLYFGIFLVYFATSDDTLLFWILIWTRWRHFSTQFRRDFPAKTGRRRRKFYYNFIFLRQPVIACMCKPGFSINIIAGFKNFMEFLHKLGDFIVFSNHENQRSQSGFW